MSRVATHIPDDMGERVLVLEHGLESLERRLGDRLDAGAQRFATIHRQLDEIDSRIAPKPSDKWRVAGFVFGIAIVMLGWVWNAARYPDRDEYRELAAKIEASTQNITNRLTEMREIQLAGSADLRLLQQRVESLQSEINRLEASHAQKSRVLR